MGGVMPVRLPGDAREGRVQIRLGVIDAERSVAANRAFDPGPAAAVRPYPMLQGEYDV